MADAADSRDIVSVKTDLVAVDSETARFVREIQFRGGAAVDVVVGILYKFEEEVCALLIELIRKAVGSRSVRFRASRQQRKLAQGLVDVHLKAVIHEQLECRAINFTVQGVVAGDGVDELPRFPPNLRG